jgi:hypothetical protein
MASRRGPVRLVLLREPIDVGRLQDLLRIAAARGLDHRPREVHGGRHVDGYHNVLPLDNRSFARAVEPRPSAMAGRTEFTYTGVNPGIPIASSPNILGRSYTVTADVDVPHGGGNGMLATLGGRWGDGACTSSTASRSSTTTC